MTIIGIEKLDYISKKTGKNVRGYNIYSSYEKNGVDGVVTEKTYISEAVFEKFPVALGDDVDFAYNRYGYVSAIVDRAF